MTIEETISHSFLARVPGIMEQAPEMTIDQAIQAAYDREELFLIELWDAARNSDGVGRAAEASREAIRIMSNSVYRRLRS